jgi:precorrin-6A/cobalt-precorrin-6A reductase
MLVWVLAGTTEGREVIALLKKKGYRVVATTTTDYGESLAREAGADVSLRGRLSLQEMVALIRERGVTHVVDATHPFAQEASMNAMEACRRTGIPYLRLERGEVRADSPLVHRCRSFHEAAEKAVGLGSRVFCALGSSNLEVFVRAANGRSRVIARVLPTVEALEKCRSLGLEPRDIVAIQGGGSLELNKALLKECGADVLVTKESGSVGAVDSKVKAALSLGLPVVLISRPEMGYPEAVEEYDEVVRWLRKTR